MKTECRWDEKGKKKEEEEQMKKQFGVDIWHNNSQ